MNETLRNAGAGDTVAVPRRALFLRDSTSEVQLAALGDEQPRTFSMVALTGKPLAHWYFGKLAIDLAGVRMKQRLPVLKDHNTEERLGYTTAMRNEPGRGIVAEGRLLQRSPAAQQVLADSADGFPWQASTYLQASKMQRLAEGQSDQVNGYTVEGPATIFRESTLREVTFTALGVDDDTSATPLSANGADEEVAVLLTAETMSNQTPAEQAAPAAPAPAAADLSAQLAQATQTGLEAERARVLAILSQAADAQHDLARELISSGASLADAASKINQDLRAKLSQARLLPASSTASLAVGNSAQVVPQSADAALAAQPEGEKKWLAQWETSAELQEEFGGDQKVWLAYQRNQANVRKFTKETKAK
jgi:hypothetical protein